jgi:hypothetical protein
MAEQNGLVARLLPNNPDAQILCQALRLPPPLSIGSDLIRIHQNNFHMELRPPPASTADFLFSPS